MRKNTIIFCLLILLCASLVALGVVITTKQNKFDDSSNEVDTALEITENTDEIAYETNEILNDASNSEDYAKYKALLYDWVLKNGTLVNGTELWYSETKENGDVYSIVCKQRDDLITIQYEKPNYQGLKAVASLNFGLFDEITLKLVDKQDIYCSIAATCTPETFTPKTPITLDSWDNPYETRLIFATKKGSTQTWTEEEKAKKQAERDKNFAIAESYIELADNNIGNFTHETMCSILNWIDSFICPKIGCTLSNLGYENYE